MGLGIIKVNLEALRRDLKFPDEVKFKAVRQTWEQEEEGTFELLVSAPNISETAPGEVFPWIRAEMKLGFCEVDEITHIKASRIKE